MFTWYVSVLPLSGMDARLLEDSFGCRQAFVPDYSAKHMGDANDEEMTMKTQHSLAQQPHPGPQDPRPVRLSAPPENVWRPRTLRPPACTTKT